MAASNNIFQCRAILYLNTVYFKMVEGWGGKIVNVDKDLELGSKSLKLFGSK